MQVYLYENRGEDDGTDAVYIGLYFVESVDARGYVVGTLLDLYSEFGEESQSRTGNKSGNFIELWYLKRHASLIFDDGQELPTLSDMVL